MVTIAGLGSMGFRHSDLGRGWSKNHVRGQRVTRSWFGGSGAGIDLGTNEGKRQLYAILENDAVAIRGASVDAVVETVNKVKNKIRDYIDANFKGSELHSNNRRRVSNAAAQSLFYDDIEQKGQYAGLVYSKWGRGKGRGGFVDFLLLHMRGGVLKAKDGGWMKIPNKEEAGSAMGQVGSFGSSDIFTLPAKGGRKAFLLRRYKGVGGRPGRTVLLATLLPQIRFMPRLAGIDAILLGAPAELENNFMRRLGAQTGAA